MIGNLYFADMCMRNSEHIFFNSAFIRILSKTYPNAKLIFYGEQKHCKFLSQELLDLDIDFRKLPILSGKLWRVIVSDIWSAILLFRFYFKITSNDMLILLNRLPLTLFVAIVLNVICRRNILSVLHGELESIINYSHVSGRTKLYHKLFLFAYKLSTKKITYVVLGKSIYDNIQMVKFGSANFVVIDHPYDYSISLNSKSRNRCGTNEINVGIIGKAMKRKNSELIFTLAELVNKSLDPPVEQISFSIAGSIEEDILAYNNGLVSYFSSHKRLDKSDFYNAIDKLDYSLSFYTLNENKGLASGSFFDSIKFEKPILALKGNSFVDYYFDKLGNIGYRFSSIQEIAYFLRHIKGEERITEYQAQVRSLKRAKNILSLDNIIKEFRKQLFSIYE